MGLNTNIFRWSLGDCSNGGISGKYDQVCVINADGPFDPTPDCPAVELMTRNIGGVIYVRAVPVDIKDECHMHGGTFIYTSDSRFGDAVEKLTGRPHDGPVALHDRVER